MNKLTVLKPSLVVANWSLREYIQGSVDLSRQLGTAVFAASSSVYLMARALEEAFCKFLEFL